MQSGHAPYKGVRPPLMLLLFLAAAGVLMAADQPLSFSHAAHIEKARMQCTDCHSGAKTRDAAGIPSIRRCMACHQFIATDRPEIGRLVAYWEKQREVPWLRVYGFAKDAAVQFRHAPHARAEIECARCHGDVASMTVAVPTVIHTMGTCVQCHRDNSASDDCLACHY